MGRRETRRRNPRWPFNDQDLVTRTALLNVRIAGGPLLRGELDRAQREGDGPASSRREERSYGQKKRFVTRYRWGDIRQWAERRGYVLTHEPITSRELERARRAPRIAGNVLSTREAASYIGRSQSWLMKARMVRRGPSFVKDGRSVGYLLADLDAWLAAHRVELAA
jgi:predicted DNA-binding transcriptional regulator AlpA